MRHRIVLLAALGAGFLLGAVAPASAERDWGRGGHRGGGHERHWRGWGYPGWGRAYPYYGYGYGPPVYYAPPPVYYAPYYRPGVTLGITIP